MTLESPVCQLLDDHQIAYRVIPIPLSPDQKPVRSLEALLESEGLPAGAVVRSLLFKTGQDVFVCLAMAGGGKADWARLREQLQTRQCRMAEFAEVEPATGYVVGAVPPIALHSSVQVLVDVSVTHYPTVVIGSGVLGYALALSSDDLRTLLEPAPMANFTKAQT